MIHRDHQFNLYLTYTKKTEEFFIDDGSRGLIGDPKRFFNFFFFKPPAHPAHVKYLGAHCTALSPSQQAAQG